MSEYKYITFIELEPKLKTKLFEVRSKFSNDFLGYVKWFAHWRKYCFWIDGFGLIFDAGCLADIRDFINKLMLERRKK